MKASTQGAAFGLLLVVSSLSAQQPATIKPVPFHPVTVGESTLPDVSPSASPELWLYTQELRRYEDPQQSVRRKAEATASQRMNRIAAMKWYGQSNARPNAMPVPFMDEYSPTWVGNGAHPSSWVGASRATPMISVQQYYQR